MGFRGACADGYVPMSLPYRMLALIQPFNLDSKNVKLITTMFKEVLNSPSHKTCVGILAVPLAALNEENRALWIFDSSMMLQELPVDAKSNHSP